MSLNLFRLLMIFLKPILPKLVQNAENFLQVAPLTWEDLQTPILNHKISEFKPLMQRIDIKDIEQLLKL
jgi:methionyl-tRNA synthetase